jgi:hypothetical protein
MQGWLLIQTFYHGLKRTAREHLDAATRGAFFALQVPATKELIEKMVAKQGWDGYHLQARTHCAPNRWYRHARRQDGPLNDM